MREIKFRIILKEIETGEIIVITNEIFNKNNGVAFFAIDKDKYKLLSTGQYTGLKDKNGKEIFEWDILIDNDDYTWIVYYADGVAQFRLKTVNETDFMELYEGMDMEKVGNIYENPELITNQQ